MRRVSGDESLHYGSSNTSQASSQASSQSNERHSFVRSSDLPDHPAFTASKAYVRSDGWAVPVSLDDEVGTHYRASIDSSSDGNQGIRGYQPQYLTPDPMPPSINHVPYGFQPTYTGGTTAIPSPPQFYNPFQPSLPLTYASPHVPQSFPQFLERSSSIPEPHQQQQLQQQHRQPLPPPRHEPHFHPHQPQHHHQQQQYIHHHHQHHQPLPPPTQQQYLQHPYSQEWQTEVEPTASRQVMIDPFPPRLSNQYPNQLQHEQLPGDVNHAAGLVIPDPKELFQYTRPLPPPPTPTLQQPPAQPPLPPPPPPPAAPRSPFTAIHLQYGSPKPSEQPSHPSRLSPSSIPAAPDIGGPSSITPNVLPDTTPEGVIRRAAVERSLRMTIADRPPTSSGRPVDPAKKQDGRRGVKDVIEYSGTCVQCTQLIAKLLLRGLPEELTVPFNSTFHCLNCHRLHVSEETDVDIGPSYNPADRSDGAKYSDTLSAAVDRVQGIVIQKDEINLPPIAGTVRRRRSSSWSRKRTADDDLLICDVCNREIGSGTLVPLNSKDSLKFSHETICTRCDRRYRRCTDCGGGGGARGVGKWRSKELFAEGRKTCQLSHLRIGALSDMSCDIWPIKDLPQGELETVIEMCRELYSSNLIGSLAVPEMLEPVVALARNFEEVKKMSVDSWALIEPMLRIDIEPGKNIRRYLCLRWSIPSPRKKGKEAASSSTGNPSQYTALEPGTIIRKGKTLAGLIIAEMDLLIGSLFLAVQTPWSTGETFDATTLLVQSLLRRVEHDIAILNKSRRLANFPLYPNLRQAWLVLFFKEDSRLALHLQNRRGYMPLDRYLQMFSDTDASHFLPIRPTFLTDEYTKGWHVYARRIGENDDYSARPAMENKLRRQRIDSTG